MLPESLDDHVTDTNPVRVVDVFVDELGQVHHPMLAPPGNTGATIAFLSRLPNAIPGSSINR